MWYPRSKQRWVSLTIILCGGGTCLFCIQQGYIWQGTENTNKKISSNIAAKCNITLNFHNLDFFFSIGRKAGIAKIYFPVPFPITYNSVIEYLLWGEDYPRYIYVHIYWGKTSAGSRYLKISKIDWVQLDRRFFQVFKWFIGVLKKAYLLLKSHQIL